MNYPQRVDSADQLENWFGHWPSFHDAEILWIKVQRNTEILPGNVWIEFSVHVWDLAKVGKELKSQKNCLVHFRFEHCTDIQFSEFNQQNQMGHLDFSVEKQILPPGNIVPQSAVVRSDKEQIFIVADEILKITFYPEFGLSGRFKCFSGKVVNIEACNEDGIPFSESS